MDRTFQDKIEHETKQLKKRKISDIGAMRDVNGEKLS